MPLVIALIVLLTWAGSSFGACPPAYTKKLTTTSGICSSKEWCDGTDAPCDSTGCNIRRISGGLTEAVAGVPGCPSGSIPLTKGTPTTTSLEAGQRVRYCALFDLAYGQVQFRSSKVDQGSAWTMTVYPPSKETVRAGTDITYGSTGTAVPLPLGPWIIELVGQATSRVNAVWTVTKELQPPKPVVQLCIAPRKTMTLFKVETKDKSASGCGTIRATLTDQNTGRSIDLNQTGTNTLTMTGTNMHGPFLVRLFPGQGPRPSSAAPCYGAYVYDLTWAAEGKDVVTEPGPTIVPGPGVPAPGLTPPPGVTTVCPPGYAKIEQAFKANPSDSKSVDGGIKATVPANGQALRYCFSAGASTVDDNGVVTNQRQLGPNDFARTVTVVVGGDTAAFKATSITVTPPTSVGPGPGGPPPPQPTQVAAVATCKDGTLDKVAHQNISDAVGSADFTGLGHGSTRVYCGDNPKDTSRLSFTVLDRSGVNLCAWFYLRVTPPPEAIAKGWPVQQQGPGGSAVIRYFADPQRGKVPAGRYIVEVIDAPGDTSCPQAIWVNFGY